MSQKNFVNKQDQLKKLCIIKSTSRDLGLKNNRMFAYCEYSNRDLAESAVRNLNETELKKRIVKVALKNNTHDTHQKNIENFFLSLNSKQKKFLLRRISKYQKEYDQIYQRLVHLQERNSHKKK